MQTLFVENYTGAQEEVDYLVALAVKAELEERMRHWKVCASCQIALQKMKKCSVCKDAHYCSRECQRKAWPEHKQTCKAKQTER